MVKPAFVALVPVVVAALGCKPNLDQTVSIVSSPRVLAVQAEPPEANPMDMVPVTYSLLMADENGPVAHAAAEWDFCLARNPLANLGPADPSCEQPGSASLTAFGGGESAVGTVPATTCSLFGPNPPPPLPGQPPGRPVDPDPTGGYYQPVSVFVVAQGNAISTLYPFRIACGFADVDSMSAAQLTSRYHLNTNPRVAALRVVGGSPLQPDSTGSTNTVSAGQKLELEVAWPDCPVSDACGDGVCGADESSASCAADCKTPVGCAGAERYVTYDLASHSVVDAREGIHVSWYATGGMFDNDRTGNAGTDPTTSSDNGWTAPRSSGPVHMWIVLADDRGGIGWSGYALAVP